MNMNNADKTRGLYNKFNVTRTDGSSGPGGRHEGCQYFVLDPAQPITPKQPLTPRQRVDAASVYTSSGPDIAFIDRDLGRALADELEQAQELLAMAKADESNCRTIIGKIMQQLREAQGQEDKAKAESDTYHAAMDMLTLDLERATRERDLLKGHLSFSESILAGLKKQLEQAQKERDEAISQRHFFCEENKRHMAELTDHARLKAATIRYELQCIANAQASIDVVQADNTRLREELNHIAVNGGKTINAVN